MLDDRDKVRIDRVRRSEKMIPFIIAGMWILGAAFWAYRVSILISLLEPAGVGTLGELVRYVSEIDMGKAEFTRLDVVLLEQRDSLKLQITIVFLVTTFLASIVPLNRLVLRMDESLRVAGEHVS